MYMNKKYSKNGSHNCNAGIKKKGVVGVEFTLVSASLCFAVETQGGLWRSGWTSTRTTTMRRMSLQGMFPMESKSVLVWRVKWWLVHVVLLQC